MAVDMFLKLDGIDGDSTHEQHKDEIEILSFSWGLTTGRSAVGAGIGAGRVQNHDITFVSHTDSASPKLMLACASGQHIADGLLTVRKAGENPVEYDDVI